MHFDVRTHDRDLLLDLPVPFVLREGKLMVEAQAFNGLNHWQRHFPKLTVTAPVVHEAPGSPQVLVDPVKWQASTQTRLVALPCAWSVQAHLRHKRAVRGTFQRLIPEHRYLCFANLGGFGAWGSLGAKIARQQDRRYAVWLDIVNEVYGNWLGPHPRELARKLYTSYGVAQTEAAIRGAELGLFHGRSVFDAYQHLPKRSEVVHNIHLKPSDAISEPSLKDKLNRVSTPRVSKVGYAGRAHRDKGAMQWLLSAQEVIRQRPRGSVTFSWLGDGPEWSDMQRFVQEHNLSDVIDLRGFVADRSALLSWLRDLDLFMFCHLTRESPRNLIEAMLSGTPIVGYESSYAADLLSEVPAGKLVPLGDAQALSQEVLSLLGGDTARLRELTADTRAAGQAFNDVRVFEHRSDLIKQHL